MSDIKLPVTASPIQLAGVCREWRQIILDYPLLWSHLDLIVHRSTLDRGYTDPTIWAERSRGSKISIHLREYYLFEYIEQDDDDSDTSTEYDDEEFAEAMEPLVRFLRPLMPQVESMTLVLYWPKDYVLSSLIDLWTTHGTLGTARSLKIRSYLEAPPSYLEPSGFASNDLERLQRHRHFFEPLELFHLDNTIMPKWSELSYHNLTSLYLSSFIEEWSLTSAELRAMLSSCPKLQHLTLCGLEVVDNHASQPLVTLNHLKTLFIRSTSNLPLLETVLSVIDSGANSLTLAIFIPVRPPSVKNRALAKMNTFLSRSNVTALHIHSSVIFFLTELGPLPRVRTLSLDGFIIAEEFYGSSVWRRNDVPYINPQPINPELHTWLTLETLHLSKCTLGLDHFRALFSLQRIRSLYLKDCEEEVQSDGQAWTSQPLSEAYTADLIYNSPKVVMYKPGWTPWLFQEYTTC
ncbi:F-box-like protein [Ceratobasidium sp. AG-Ba]|nr:F-box-like protein [Ceratobasidium sp. AG-Ba]